MKLNYRKYGEGKPVIILHGIFGSSDNWQTVGRQLADHFQVYLVDLRNHGLSPHSDAFDYDVMAEDLSELMQGEGLKTSCLIGHSMGGKTAMHFASRYPERVEKLIVVDIAPKYYPPHHQDVLAGFHAVDLNVLKSRKEADEQMATKIANPGVRQFILKNLGRNDQQKFEWKLNLSAIEQNIDRIGKGLETGSTYPGPTLFIGGGNSRYIQKEDEALIHSHFPNARIITIDGAGHWVHAEKPDELIGEVMAFLP